MDPMTIIGLITAASNLVSPLIQSALPQGDVQNINPMTDQIMAMLNNALVNAQTQQAGFQSQASQAGQQLGDISGRIESAAQGFSDISQPSANAWFEQFLQNVPEYQEIARGVAQEAVELQGRSIQEQANLASQQALEQVAQQFAGQTFSGAAAKAAGAGAAAPIVAGQNQLAQTQANIFQNLFGNLSGQGQQLGAQATQNQFNNALQALTQQIAGQSTAGQTTAQQGNLFSGLANQQGNLVSQLFGQIGAEGGQILQQGAQSQAPTAVNQGLTNLFNILADPNNQFIMNAFQSPGGSGGTSMNPQDIINLVNNSPYTDTMRYY